MPRKRPAVAQLERFYTTFRGELQAYEAQIVRAGVSGPDLAAALEPEMAKRRDTLAHIQACLLLFDPTWGPERAPGVRRRKKTSPLARRKLLVHAYHVLRAADRPLTTREIMDLSARREGGLEPAQAGDTALASGLTTLLRGQARAGALRGSKGRPVRWQIILGPAASGLDGEADDPAE